MDPTMKSSTSNGKGEDSREKNADFYDRTFLEHEHWKNHYTSSRYYPLWSIIVDRILRSGAESIIDIGCGAGQFASFLKDKGIRKYVGLDFSQERIKHAKIICPDFNFIVSDVFETNVFSVNDYDTAICLEFLEHVERDLDTIEMIRAGTRFFGTVPNFPYSSHVRHFNNPQEVIERYGKKFQDFSVDIHLQNDKGTKFFLMDGTVV
jgi:2-polyprenyl-3-methyl-5-hydroxy-6-metoxy-1,4-benzoquinol methylase